MATDMIAQAMAMGAQAAANRLKTTVVTVTTGTNGEAQIPAIADVSKYHLLSASVLESSGTDNVKVFFCQWTNEQDERVNYMQVQTWNGTYARNTTFKIRIAYLEV